MSVSFEPIAPMLVAVVSVTELIFKSIKEGTALGRKTVKAPTTGTDNNNETNPVRITTKQNDGSKSCGWHKGFSVLGSTSAQPINKNSTVTDERENHVRVEFEVTSSGFEI